jgi:hypothetical protein
LTAAFYDELLVVDFNLQTGLVSGVYRNQDRDRLWAVHTGIDTQNGHGFVIGGAMDFFFFRVSSKDRYLLAETRH